ncbi:HAD-IIA family hydrolase [Rhizobium terrae]|uniref:HAD-IIA family hydrolase n=1 Tax=Rhizobium terrae TaxID=2171756 RepID=UPI0013C3778A|nr:HAD family hydrolase [Rhizobium terrae]
MLNELEAADGYLFDLDGTLLSGGALLPDARAMLAEARHNFAIVSNNAEHLPSQIAAMLADLSLDVPAERIVTAGAETLKLVSEELPGAAILLLCSGALSDFAVQRKLVPSDERVDAVVVGRDRNFSYEKLRLAANAVLNGAQLFVANPDLTHPSPGGLIVPETGSLAAAILACTGNVPYRVVGKPEAHLFRRGLSVVGTEARRTIMVGDNHETDGAGAARMGIRYVHIGEHKPSVTPSPTTGNPSLSPQAECAGNTMVRKGRP